MVWTGLHHSCCCSTHIPHLHTYNAIPVRVTLLALKSNKISFAENETSYVEICALFGISPSYNTRDTLTPSGYFYIRFFSIFWGGQCLKLWVWHTIALAYEFALKSNLWYCTGAFLCTGVSSCTWKKILRNTCFYWKEKVRREKTKTSDWNRAPSIALAKCTSLIQLQSVTFPVHRSLLRVLINFQCLHGCYSQADLSQLLKSASLLVMV